MTRKMKIVNSLYEWNFIMIVWIKVDCVNKLNNISRHTFRFLKYVNNFRLKWKFPGRERKISSYKPALRTPFLQNTSGQLFLESANYAPFGVGQLFLCVKSKCDNDHNNNNDNKKDWISFCPVVSIHFSRNLITEGFFCSTIWLS